MRLKKMRGTGTGVVDMYMRIVGMTSPKIPVGDLSGGQAQAVAIACAVHLERDVVLLDEPTSAWSVCETERMPNIMRKLSDSGMSSVFVTGHLYHTFRVCGRFAIPAHSRNVHDAMKVDTLLNELTGIIMTH